MAEVIDPPTISSMTQEEIEQHVLALRERRNRIARVRSMAHHRSRDTVTPGDVSVKMERIGKKLDKALEELNKRMEKAEKLINEYAALRLESGDAPEVISKELAA